MSPGAFLTTWYFMADTSLLLQVRLTVQELSDALEVAYSVTRAPKAAFISGIPYPILSFGLLNVLPASFTARLIPMLLNSGNPSHSQLPSPPFMGHPIAVPVFVTHTLLLFFTIAPT